MTSLFWLAIWSQRRELLLAAGREGRPDIDLDIVLADVGVEDHLLGDVLDPGLVDLVGPRRFGSMVTSVAEPSSAMIFMTRWVS
jgi:hypothetical protein